MESVPRSLNYELPHALHIDSKYAQQILENSRTAVHASTPTITTFDASTTASSDFLQKLGASILNSIQLQNLHRSAADSGAALNDKKDMEFAPNHVVLGTSSFSSVDELQKQLEYDKFMNEVWIGVVLTLILISMIFCICSCALYHQFRTWKRNYHSNVSQTAAHTPDMEALKSHTELDDPVPEYTLVSGLPSYEAALDLMRKTQTCLIVHPSVLGLFNKNEIATSSQQQQQSINAEATTPLLSCTTNALQNLTIPSYEEAVILTCVNEKSPQATTKKCTAINETLRTAPAEDATAAAHDDLRNQHSHYHATATATTAATVTIATVGDQEKAPSYDDAVLLVKAEKR